MDDTEAGGRTEMDVVEVDMKNPLALMLSDHLLASPFRTLAAQRRL